MLSRDTRLVESGFVVSVQFNCFSSNISNDRLIVVNNKTLQWTWLVSFILVSNVNDIFIELIALIPHVIFCKRVFTSSWKCYFFIKKESEVFNRFFWLCCLALRSECRKFVLSLFLNWLQNIIYSVFLEFKFNLFLSKYWAHNLSDFSRFSFAVKRFLSPEYTKVSSACWATVKLQCSCWLISAYYLILLETFNFLSFHANSVKFFSTIWRPGRIYVNFTY